MEKNSEERIVTLAAAKLTGRIVLEVSAGITTEDNYYPILKTHKEVGIEHKGGTKWRVSGDVSFTNRSHASHTISHFAVVMLGEEFIGKIPLPKHLHPNDVIPLTFNVTLDEDS